MGRDHAELFKFVFLTTLAYQLADCLSGDELTILAADLVAMADLLANIVAGND